MHLHLQWKINLAFLPFPADTFVMFLAICCFRHSLHFAVFHYFHSTAFCTFAISSTAQKLASFSTLLFPLPKYLSTCICTTYFPVDISYFQMTYQKWILGKKNALLSLVNDKNSNFQLLKPTKFLLAEDIIRQSGSKCGSSGSNGPFLAKSSIDVASEQSYFGCWIVSFYSQFIWLCKLCRSKRKRKKFQDWRKIPHFPPSGHIFVIVWTPRTNEWRLKDARNIF